MSKATQKKPQRNLNKLSELNTHEEEKMEEKEEVIPFRKINQREPLSNRNANRMMIEEAGDEEEEFEDINLDDAKNKENLKNQNQDRIVEIAHNLILKNKINAKNAFDVPMLNVREMSDFHNTTDGDQAWKKLSTAIEASAKIYGFRVDSVHTETYKVLGGLNRTDLEDSEKNKEREVPGEEREEENIAKKSRRDQNGESTLEKNITNLDAVKYDLEFDVDPLFQKTSAKFDESGAKGLLLNNLSTDSSLALLFDSGNILQEEKDTISQKMSPYSQSKRPKGMYESLQDLGILQPNSQKLFYQDLCPQLSKFKENMKNDAKDIFNLSTFDTYDHTFDRSLSSSEAFDASKFARNEKAMMEELDNLVVDEGEPLLDMENLLEPNREDEKKYQEPENLPQEDLFDHPLPEDDNEMEEPEIKKEHSAFDVTNIEKKVAQLGQGRQASLIANDLGNWMDPGNWKLATQKNAREKKEKTKVEENQEEGKQKKKSDNLIDFDLNQKIDPSEIFGKSKNKGTQNLKINPNESFQVKQLYLLPIDLHIDAERLNSAFLRQIPIRKTNEDAQYEVINDSDGIAQQNEDVDDGAGMDDNHGDLNFQNDFQDNTAPKGGLFDLMEAGKRVDLQTKGQVPIRELKEKIWTSIQTNINFLTEEAPPEPKKDKKQKKAMEVEQSQDTLRFSSVLNGLPNIVGTAKSKRVSVQTCFVTLLHLANEKNLKFSTYKDGEDFLIFKEKVH